MTAPVPSLDFYAYDTEALIRVISERGVHPSEVHVVVRELKALYAENDDFGQALHEAQTYRANGDAEELSDLRIELQRAKDRIAVLEARLHDERRKHR